MTQRTRRITYANVASTLALALALGSGGAYAANLAKNSVASKQIKNASIKTQDYAPGSVDGSVIKDASVSGADLAPGTVPAPPALLPGRVIVQRVDVALTAGSPGAPVSAFIACQAGQKLI